MTRAVLLSASADPFLALFVHKLFQRDWYNEVDAFYVHYNNYEQFPKEVVSEFLSRISQDPKVRIISMPIGVGSGIPIRDMSLLASEDLVMLLENDGFIFTPGKVDECFKRMESGECDALGSPRGSCSDELMEVLQKKYQLDYSGDGDTGPNFWPNFFFCKRDDLLNTDLDFGSRVFEKGKYYDELHHTMEDTGYADTFVWASIQMRHNGVRFAEIPQYHASPSEIEDKRDGRINWAGSKPFWIHAGSLSAGWRGYVSGDMQFAPTDEGSKQEMETRAAFWLICQKEISGFYSFKMDYWSGVKQLIKKSGLDEKRIEKKISIYKELMRL